MRGLPRKPPVGLDDGSQEWYTKRKSALAKQLILFGSGRIWASPALSAILSEKAPANPGSLPSLAGRMGRPSISVPRAGDRRVLRPAILRGFMPS